jgi:CheY-like chemotaxis protein
MSEHDDRKVILLVDDDDIFAEAVATVLETAYAVRTASNGTEALDIVARELPHLIILDVMMDYISEGFDVARKLRADDKTKSVPIIMLTGVDQMYNYRMEFDESWVPCDRYLEKPVQPEKLLAEVESLIG